MFARRTNITEYTIVLRYENNKLDLISFFNSEVSYISKVEGNLQKRTKFQHFCIMLVMATISNQKRSKALIMGCRHVWMQHRPLQCKSRRSSGPFGVDTSRNCTGLLSIDTSRCSSDSCGINTSRCSTCLYNEDPSRCSSGPCDLDTSRTSTSLFSVESARCSSGHYVV
jgi:hypothetical protein